MLKTVWQIAARRAMAQAGQAIAHRGSPASPVTQCSATYSSRCNTDNLAGCLRTVIPDCVPVQPHLQAQVQHRQPHWYQYSI